MRMERSDWIRSTVFGRGREAIRERWRGNFRAWGSLSGEKSWRQRDSLCDYREYRLSGREWLCCLGEGTAACGLTAFVFYRSFAAFLLFLPAAFAWPFLQRRKFKEKRQEQLRLQFKEAILILASSLAAGYSVENAFSAGAGELEELYGADGIITREFSYIAKQLRMNRTVESLMTEFAGRSGLEEVESFAEIFAVSKRSRGELVSVVGHVAHVIGDRIQVREEILTMTAEKQFEQKIMNLMPYLIVVYVDLSSPGFFSQMYGTVIGRLVMTACLAVYLASCVISGRILQIEL